MDTCRGGLHLKTEERVTTIVLENKAKWRSALLNGAPSLSRDTVCGQKKNPQQQLIQHYLQWHVRLDQLSCGNQTEKLEGLTLKEEEGGDHTKEEGERKMEGAGHTAKSRAI